MWVEHIFTSKASEILRTQRIQRKILTLAPLNLFTFFWAFALLTFNLSRVRWCKITHRFAHALIDDSLWKSDGSLQFLYKYWWHKLLSFLTLDGSRLSAKRDLDCAFSLHEGIKAVIRLGWTDLSIEKRSLQSRHSVITFFGRGFCDYIFH